MRCTSIAVALVALHLAAPAHAGKDDPILLGLEAGNFHEALPEGFVISSQNRGVFSLSWFRAPEGMAIFDDVVLSPGAHVISRDVSTDPGFGVFFTYRVEFWGRPIPTPGSATLFAFAGLVAALRWPRRASHA